MTQAAPGLELTRPGKDKSLLTPRGDEGKPMWVERDHPSASEVRTSDFVGELGATCKPSPHSDNRSFIGDSLDMLRILNEVPEYRRLHPRLGVVIGAASYQAGAPSGTQTFQ